MFKKTILELAQETIDFQGPRFGLELEAFIQSLRDNKTTNRTLKDPETSKKLSDIIKKYTGLSVTPKIDNYAEFVGPHINLPILTGNHIFDNQWLKGIIEFMAEDDPKVYQQFLIAVRKRKAESRVDLKNGRVHGVWSDMNAVFGIGPKFIMDESMPVREIVAIILHELGHLFTYFEYFNRLATSNQVLASLSSQWTKTSVVKERENMLALAMEALDITKRELPDITKPGSAEAAILVLMKEGMTLSQTDSVVYDYVTSEQLADQFAARHGYGLDVVMALSKCNYITRSQSALMRKLTYISETAHVLGMATISIAALTVGSFVLFGLLGLAISIAVLFTATTDEKDYIYDKDIVRIKRMREQAIHFVKISYNNAEIVATIHKQIKEFDLLISTLVDKEELLSKIADFLLPFKKSSAAAQKLQRDLEELAANDLFLSSARLKHL